MQAMAALFRMVRKYPVGTAFVGGFLAILAVLAVQRLAEPRLQGKGIREWVEQLPYDTGTRSEAAQAIESFGLEAIPYLLEAMRRPSAAEEWLASKAPHFLRGLAPDPREQRTISLTAAYKLGVMAEREQEANELRPGAPYPVADAALPAIIQLMKVRPQRVPDLISTLQMFGPAGSNAFPLVHSWWRAGHPRQGYAWRDGALLLASYRNPALLADLLPFLNPTNSASVQTATLEVIGELGRADEDVRSALRRALTSPDERFVLPALQACAMLGLSLPEAEAVVRRRFEEGRPLSCFEDVLLWRSDTNNGAAKRAILHDLSPGSYLRPGSFPQERIQTARLLERTGPAAKPFLPALVSMLAEPAPMLHNAAGRALRAIDPPTAEREIPKRFGTARLKR